MNNRVRENMWEPQKYAGGVGRRDKRLIKKEIGDICTHGQRRKNDWSGE